jgi:prefoldin subunit 5
MNKIERAIEDTKTELKRLRNNKLCIDAKIEALEEQLESLESINRTHSIPHQEDIPNQTPPPIIHE